VREVTPEAATGGTNTDPGTKEQFERALNMKIERLDEEIRELLAKLGSLKDAAKAKWTEKMAEVSARRSIGIRLVLATVLLPTGAA